MDSEHKRRVKNLLKEIDCVDRNTLTLKEEVQYKNCPFCEIDDGEIIDTYQTREALFYKFKRCNRCSLIYPYPRPSKKTLEDYFKDDDFSKESEEKFVDIDRKRERRAVEEKRGFSIGAAARKAWRNSPLCYSYQEFFRYAKKRYLILDVGSGHGELAEMLSKRGCVVEAVEPNPYRARYIRERTGIKVYNTTLEEADIRPESYDMVIFSQVMMHLFSIKTTVEKVRAALKPGGYLISSQINFNAIMQQTKRSPYPGRGHSAFNMCSWFTPESMRKILEMSGFEIIELIHRPTGLFENIFVEGYPGGGGTKLILTLMDKILKVILMKTGTSDYFAVVARKTER